MQARNTPYQTPPINGNVDTMGVVANPPQAHQPVGTLHSAVIPQRVHNALSFHASLIANAQLRANTASNGVLVHIHPPVGVAGQTTNPSNPDGENKGDNRLAESRIYLRKLYGAVVRMARLKGTNVRIQTFEQFVPNFNSMTVEEIDALCLKIRNAMVKQIRSRAALSSQGHCCSANREDATVTSADTRARNANPRQPKPFKPYTNELRFPDFTGKEPASLQAQNCPNSIRDPAIEDYWGQASSNEKNKVNPFMGFVGEPYPESWFGEETVEKSKGKEPDDERAYEGQEKKVEAQYEWDEDYESKMNWGDWETEKVDKTKKGKRATG